MASNSHTINNGTGDVTTIVDAWYDSETGNSVKLYVRTRVHGNSSYGPWGYGVVGQSGYTGNGAQWAEAGRGVFNYGNTVVDGTKSWTVSKTHSGWTANCWAKIWGETVSGYGAYGSSDDVRCNVWIPATTSYTVSYNANNGTGAPSSQTKWYGETLTLSSTKPSRTGYTFQGWATSSSGSVAYKSGASYTSNSAVTLYAVWKANTYTVTYNANGGSGAPSSQTKTYGVTLTLSSVKPTKTDYAFQGWATSSTGSVAHRAGGSYTANAAVTLYAVWKQNVFTCIISYDGNGGSGVPENQTHTKNDTSSTSTLSSTKPTRIGYSFLGWSTDKKATSATYIAGGKYTNSSFSNGDTITLYAVWIKEYANMFMEVPDGKSADAVYVYVPDGKSLSAFYYKVDDLYLQSSDDMLFVGSGGEYIMVKDGA